MPTEAPGPVFASYLLAGIPTRWRCGGLRADGVARTVTAEHRAVVGTGVDEIQ